MSRIPVLLPMVLIVAPSESIGLGSPAAKAEENPPLQVATKLTPELLGMDRTQIVFSATPPAPV